MEHGLGHLPFTEKQIVTPTGMFIRHSMWFEDFSTFSSFQFSLSLPCGQNFSSWNGLRLSTYFWIYLELFLKRENILGINKLVISYCVSLVIYEVFHPYPKALHMKCELNCNTGFLEAFEYLVSWLDVDILSFRKPLCCLI